MTLYCRWLGRAVLVPVGFFAVACGGAVDLDSPKAAGGGGVQMGGAGTTAGSGGAAPTNGANGPVPEGGKSGPMDGGSSAVGGSNGSAGAAAVPEMGPIAWLAYDAQPVGKTRGIYLMTATNGGMCSKRITSDEFDAKQPAFTDDGNFVAYASNESGTYQIYLLELATGTTKQLTDLPGGASYPTISPNGLRLAFVTGDPEALRDGLVDAAPGAGDLMLVTVKTLETQLVKASEPEYPYFSPAFSGDDRLFVANSFKLLALYLDPNGAAVTVERTLSPAPGLPQDPAPSPDGQNLAYADSCSDSLNVYVLRIDVGSTRNCTAPTREIRHDQGFVSLDWGSFGFIAAEYENPKRGLYLFDERDLSGGGGLVTEKLARNPDWAPTSFAPACD